MSEYKVIGTRAIYGTPPGGTFDAELTDFVEAILVGAGHIQKVTVHRFKGGEFTEESVTQPKEEEDG